jgi:hypothetical protein
MESENTNSSGYQPIDDKPTEELKQKSESTPTRKEATSPSSATPMERDARISQDSAPTNGAHDASSPGKYVFYAIVFATFLLVLYFKTNGNKCRFWIFTSDARLLDTNSGVQ